MSSSEIIKVIILLSVVGSLIFVVMKNILDLIRVKFEMDNINDGNTRSVIVNFFYDTLFSYSAWIGFFERIIIFIALVFGQFIFISILISLKAYIRVETIKINELKKNENKMKERHMLTADYFIFAELYNIIYSFAIYYIVIYSNPNHINEVVQGISKLVALLT